MILLSWCYSALFEFHQAIQTIQALVLHWFTLGNQSSCERFANNGTSLLVAYRGYSRMATFHSVSFSQPNPVWFGKVTPKKCVGFSKPIPVWFGKKKTDFARRRFQTKFRLVWKILTTIANALKIPNQIQSGLEKLLTIANALNLGPIPVLFCKISI